LVSSEPSDQNYNASWAPAKQRFRSPKSATRIGLGPSLEPPPNYSASSKVRDGCSFDRHRLLGRTLCQKPLRGRIFVLAEAHLLRHMKQQPLNTRRRAADFRS
jgi:hypothetical protein